MKSIVFITGSTGSGKTTLARSMINTHAVMSTGDVVRRLMLPTDSPIAPQRLDSIVLAAVERFVQEHDASVIETVPRSATQLWWIDAFRKMGCAVSVVRTVSNTNTRLRRIKLRDAKDPSRLALDIRKLKGEGSDFTRDGYFSRLLAMLPTEHTVVDTSKVVASIAEAELAKDLTFRKAMECVASTGRAVGGEHPVFERMLRRCADELLEVEGAVTNVERLEELVDVLFFVFQAVRALHLDASDLAVMFVKKFYANGHRVDTGCKVSAIEFVGQRLQMLRDLAGDGIEEAASDFAAEGRDDLLSRHSRA